MYSLLQAANDVSSRGNNRDNDLNVFVQRRYCTTYLRIMTFGFTGTCQHFVVVVFIYCINSNMRLE